MFSLICTRIHGWVNNGETGDLKCYHAHYDVTVMISQEMLQCSSYLWHELENDQLKIPAAFFSSQWVTVTKPQLPHMLHNLQHSNEPILLINKDLYIQGITDMYKPPRNHNINMLMQHNSVFLSCYLGHASTCVVTENRKHSILLPDL